MEAFARKYRSFLISSLYLVTGLVLAGYAVIYSPREVAVLDARRLAQSILQENGPLNDQFARRREADKSAEAGIRSLPAFLEHINSISQKTKVIIKELTPAREGELKFNLKIETNYLTFLSFAGELEALNVSIDDLQVRPFRTSEKPPVHAIEFSLTPRGDAAPLEDDRVTALLLQVAGSEKRNPFQRFAFYAKRNEVVAETDLTWQYRLSGIGRSGDRKIATINGKDYGVGDELAAGLVVTVIEVDHVRLRRTAETGSYILRFRRSKIDNKPS